MEDRKLYETPVTFYPTNEGMESVTYDHCAYILRGENETIEHIMPSKDKDRKYGIGFFTEDYTGKIEISGLYISHPCELIVSYNLADEPVEPDFWGLVERYLLHYTIYSSCHYYMRNKTVENMYLLKSIYQIPDKAFTKYSVTVNLAEIGESYISYLLEHSEKQISL